MVAWRRVFNGSLFHLRIKMLIFYLKKLQLLVASREKNIKVIATFYISDFSSQNCELCFAIKKNLSFYLAACIYI